MASGVLIAGQKSGVVHSFDPEGQGKKLWSIRYPRISKDRPLSKKNWMTPDKGRIVHASERGELRKPSGMPGLMLGGVR